MKELPLDMILAAQATFARVAAMSGTLTPRATDERQVMAAWNANEAARPRWLHPNIAAIFRDQRGFFGGGGSPSPPPAPPPPPEPEDPAIGKARAQAALRARKRLGRAATFLSTSESGGGGLGGGGGAQSLGG